VNKPEQTSEVPARRNVLQALGFMAIVPFVSNVNKAAAVSMPFEKVKVLCDEECVASLENIEIVTTESGLQYKDIRIGKGDYPPIGYQVLVNYVAQLPNGRVFDSSIDKGSTYTVRVGAGLVVAGLDEGLQTMKAGGFRRIYVPGNLAFDKNLKAAAGRPSVPANSPIIFDVELLYIPGMETEDE
jgi:peptidylprolyl isomerase